MAVEERAWRTSSYSAQHSECVEVTSMQDGAGIRDSKNRSCGELRVSRTAWRAFIRELAVAAE